MEFWRPVPQALMTELLMCKWTRENPAPEAVVFMVAIDRTLAGRPWSARKLGEHSGWSRWKANRMIDTVKAFVAEWNGLENRPIFTNGEQPPMLNNVHHLHGQTDHKPTTNQPQNDHHARAINNNTTSQEQPIHNEGGVLEDSVEATKPKRVKSKTVDLNKVWTSMEDVRLSASPGTHRAKLGKRRETLRARVGEHGTETVLHAWDWLWKSNDHRARFLRENGYGIETFLRASKLRDYVDRSKEWNPDADLTGGGGWFTDDDFDEQGNLKGVKDGV